MGFMRPYGAWNRAIISAPAVAALVLVLIVPTFSFAGVRSEIEAKNEEIKRLEEEAAKYRGTLDELERAVDTLEAEVRRRDRAIKSLEASIRVTKAKIGRTNLEIQELGREIGEKSQAIQARRGELGALVARLALADGETPLEVFVKNETLSAFFTAVDHLRDLQGTIQGILGHLREAKQDLEAAKAAAESKRRELAALAEELADQKALAEDERTERAELLRTTKNQERRYQELLAELERKREALQQEINALESDLEADFDRSVLPAPGKGILGWSLPPPIFITQYFGRTSFARSGGYNGKGHNGIDLRASASTPVFAAEGGIVRASGDTDRGCRRASYGRWVLVDHPNNLSTLYAHLSLIKIRAGEVVNRGELIGYSGRTGYATGPHLHFSLFAKHAVFVGELKSRVCGRIMVLPLSPFGGYLNPLEYL